MVFGVPLILGNHMKPPYWQNSSLFTAFRVPNYTNNMPCLAAGLDRQDLSGMMHSASAFHKVQDITVNPVMGMHESWGLYPPVLSLRMSKSSIRRISLRSWRISTCENWKGSGTKCEATTRSMTAILARQTRSNTMQKQTRWRRRWSFESRIWERHQFLNYSKFWMCWMFLVHCHCHASYWTT